MRFRCLTLVAFLAATAFMEAAATYTVTDLGTLGGSTSDAYGINSDGVVVGRAATLGNSSYEATQFATAGNIDLGNFGGGLVNEARAINASGVIVGTNSLPGNMTTSAFVYFGGTLLNLATLGGSSNRAHGISDNGQITGSSLTTGDTNTHAFRSKNGVMTDLGGNTSVGFGINNAGHIVGQSSFRPFVAIADTIVPLINLGTGNSGAAYAINGKDQIVGEANIVFGGFNHPFLYANGVMKDLGLIANGDLGRAYAINDSGVIVGEGNLTPNGATYHAFIYLRGKVVDLNGLIPAGSGWELETARAINSKGQIVGTGTHNGQDHAFLLTRIVVPPPVVTEKPPKVFVNGATHIVTKFKRRALTGTSNGDVASIRYKLGAKPWRRAHGPASGWKFSVRLKPHRNVLRVIAVSPTGKKSAPVKIVIVRKP